MNRGVCSALAFVRFGEGGGIRQGVSSRGLNWSPAAWGRDGAWLAVAAPALIFAALMLRGAAHVSAAMFVIVLGAALLGLVLAFPGHRRELRRTSGLALPAVLFAAVILVGVMQLTPYGPDGPHPVWAYLDLSPGAVTVDKSRTLREIIALLGLGVFFGLGAVAGASDARARLSVDALLAAGAAVSFHAFFELASGGLGYGRQRINGPLESVNPLATLFGVLLLLAVARGVSQLRAKGWVAAAPHLGAALVMAGTLLATGSRAGTAAAAAGLLVFVALFIVGSGLRWSRALLVGVLVVALAGAVALAGGGLVVDRFIEGSVVHDARRTFFTEHLEVLKTAPLMGQGLGGWETVNRTLLHPGNARDLAILGAPMSAYLGWLEEAGLLGAAAMFGCLGLILAWTLRNSLRRSRMRTLLFGLLAADAVVLLHIAVDLSMQVYGFALLWTFLLGLQARLAQGSAAPRRPARLVRVGAGFAAAAAVLGIWGLASMATGAGALQRPVAQGLGWGLDAAAGRALSGRDGQPDLDRAEALSRQVVGLMPYANIPRVRLARIEARRHGGMTARGAAYIAQSYRLVPIDRNVADYRIKTALEHWQAMPPETRTAVREEALTFARIELPRHVATRKVLSSIRNPEGMREARLMLVSLELEAMDAELRLGRAVAKSCQVRGMSLPERRACERRLRTLRAHPGRGG